MILHPEVMPPSQQNMLRQLGPIASARGFDLAGGTALAIQLGHRRSVDLDWFSAAAIDPIALSSDLKDAGVQIEVTDVEEGTLHGIAGGVKLSFIEYRYRHLVQPMRPSRCQPRRPPSFRSAARRPARAERVAVSCLHT
jgi:hypothetical protein